MRLRGLRGLSIGWTFVLVLVIAFTVGDIATATSGPAGSRVSCSAANVERTVLAFTSAFNSGAHFRLGGLWAPAHEFRWYSVTRTRTQHYVTYERRILLRYFVLRHRQQERLNLTRLKFNGIGGGFGHFEYSLTRRARDLADGRLERYHGKGAVTCAGLTPRLAVWSMGRS
jgi:hypothetical protein